MKLRKGSKVTVSNKTNSTYATVLSTAGKTISVETIEGKTRNVKAERLTVIPAKEYNAVVNAIETKKNTPTKKEECIKIYKRVNRRKNATRKDFISAMVEEAELSLKGASTYFQNIKLGRWA